MWKIVPIYDNAHSHVASLITNLLASFTWNVFLHPPYSPDLAASEFHLYPGIKRDVEGRRFAMEDELHADVVEALPKKSGKLVPHWN